MSDIVMSALELCVMIAVMIVVTKIIPMIKQHIDQEKLNGFMNWVEVAVAYAQQCFNDNGSKKQIVTNILREIRDHEKLPLSNDQIDILIEAAVKQLKLIENDVIFVGGGEYPEEDEYGTEG